MQVQANVHPYTGQYETYHTFYFISAREIITLSVFEAQFLLLVGEVSGDCSHRRHNNSAQDACQRAGAGLCEAYNEEKTDTSLKNITLKFFSTRNTLV